MRLAWLLVAVTVSCALASPALAWSNQGHMVTGAMAYDDLAASNDRLVSQIETIMASHPDKVRFEQGLGGYVGAARTRRLFELMARWPDDIRGGPYDHPAWHYWLRAVHSTVDPGRVPAAFLQLTTGEAAEAYVLSLATVRDSFAPASERAVALCWLFHLAGDIQQPLHAGTLVSGRFPLSDRAGTAAYVRPSAVAPAVSLHEYWDDAIGDDADDDPNVEAMRQRLEAAFPRKAFAELDGRADGAAFHGWADESLGLARSTAYVNATFEGAVSAGSAQPVSAAYSAARRATGERRISIAGYRIADAVRASLGAGGASDRPASQAK